MNFTLDITLANIFTLITLIIAFTVGWIRMQTKVNYMQGEIRDIKAAVAKQADTCQRTITCRQQQYDAVLAELGIIKTNIEWIKQTLNEKQFGKT